ncbi:hypothetical protein [Sinorhizobium fredii]|uniref:hypothetical protein n=1 Tax=Rhizobium fredii TaxID=380 RepID=UPI0035194733
MNGTRDLLQTYRALLDLREHDLDRLEAEHEADFLLLLTLLEQDRLAAAKAIIRRRLA